MFKNSIFVIAFFISLIFFNCSKPATINSSLVDFSKTHIARAIKESGNSTLNITWNIDSLKQKPQAYTISVNQENIIITGGDHLGLMYGGLEVAEQLTLNGNIENTSHEPYILKRGLKMNIPLDARTPSYDDSGDAAIKNVKTVWEWDFWKNYLDQMALNRYNVLSLWNPHPFPSIIKLKDYPDVALNDIYTTSYKPNGLENEMGDPGLVSSIVFDNLELVKKQPIDDKIAFWQKVMQYAKDRGIDIYWVNWNICPNSVATPVDPMYKTFRINMRNETPGKHGITHQMDNPITIAYHRAAIKEFLKTYPHVKGIGITSGEHMPLNWEGSNREEWVWNTYGLGILDLKKEQTDRQVDLIHRVWHSDMKQIMNYWGNYPDTFDVSFKYAKARLYSSPSINFYDDHMKSMKQYNLKSWWNLRNDDIFVYRWANTNYVRDFIKNMPKEDTKGYYMGSDGYVWGKEFISKIPKLKGEYEFDKHKFRFMLWGRLGYNNKLSEDVIFKTFKKHYKSQDAQLLFNTWQTASKIIPQVNRFHWRNWDADWSVEACRAREKLGGFRDIFDFVDNPVMPNQNLINCKDFVEKEFSGIETSEETPRLVSERLISWSNQSIEAINKLDVEDTSVQTKALISDIESMSYLGLFYAFKINAATNLAYFQKKKDKKHKYNTIKNMQMALEAVIKYAEISNANYKTQMLARPGALDWDNMVNEVKKELQAVMKL